MVVSRVLLVVGLMLLSAGVAGASRFNWQGTTTHTFAELPLLVITGGGVATVNGSSGTLPAHLDTLRLVASRGGVTGSDTFIGPPTPPTTLSPIVSVFLDQVGATGTLAPISGAVASTTALTQKTVPIGGLLRLILLGPAGVGSVPLLLTQPTTLGGVEGLGVGGTITGGGSTSPSGALLSVTLEAAPWTVKTATAIDQTLSGASIAVTRMGFAHGPLSGTTSTAQPGGVVQLVTPTQITSNVPVAGFQSAMLSQLLIRFIPEPDLLLLLVVGLIGLGLLGSRRGRS